MKFISMDWEAEAWRAFFFLKLLLCWSAETLHLQVFMEYLG